MVYTYELDEAQVLKVADIDVLTNRWIEEF